MRYPIELSWALHTSKALIRQAEGYEEKGRFEKAAGVYQYLASKAEEKGSAEGIIESYSLLSNALDKMGELSEAQNASEKAASTAESFYGPDGTPFAKLARMAASLSIRQSDWQKALTWLKKAAPATRSEGKPSEIIMLAQAAGDCERKQGNIHKALEWYNEALSLTDKMPEAWNQSSAMATLANNAGLCHKFLGSPNSALNMYSKAWNIYKGKPELAEDARAVASNIGNAWKALGKNANAILWLLEAVNDVKNPPAVILINISAAYKATEDYQNALLWGLKALQAREAEFGKSHIALVTLLSELADIHEKLEDKSQAFECLKRAIAILEQEASQNAIECSNLSLNCARVAFELKNWRDSIFYYKKALDTDPKKEHEINIKIATVYYEGRKDSKSALEWLAKAPGLESSLFASKIYEESKNLDKALKWAEEAEKFADPITANEIAAKKAMLCYKLKDYEKAYGLFTSGVMAAVGYEPDAGTLRAYAVAAEKTGHLDEAFKSYKKVLEMRREKLGDSHKDTLSSFNDMSYFYHLKKDYLSALECDEKILSAMMGSPATKEAATAYSNIGVTFRMLSQYSQALECHQKALQIRKDIFGPQSDEAAWSEKRLADVYQDMGDYDSALLHRVNAAKYQKNVDRDAYEELSLLCSKMGNEEDAIRYHIIAACF